MGFYTTIKNYITVSNSGDNASVSVGSELRNKGDSRPTSKIELSNKSAGVQSIGGRDSGANKTDIGLIEAGKPQIDNNDNNSETESCADGLGGYYGADGTYRSPMT